MSTAETPSTRVALVTGASRGIGYSIAVRLARQGYKVFGTATTEAGAEKIGNQGRQDGVNLTGIAANVNQEQDLQNLYNSIEHPVSVLVNNAGITRDNLMMRMSEDDWEAVINTNLRSVYRLSKLFLRDMTKQRWGRIINLSSVVAVSGNPGQCNYAAAKAGILGFTKSLALEIASRNVTVNAVSPGFIETDMTGSLSEKQIADITGRIPSARFGRPEEVAALVAFLASEESAYITGENILINGGMYLD